MTQDIVADSFEGNSVFMQSGERKSPVQAWFGRNLQPATSTTDGKGLSKCSTGTSE